MRLLKAVFVGLALSTGMSGALGQMAAECKSVRAERAAFLLLCGDVLHSWELKHRDERWRTTGDLHGRQAFYCALTGSQIPRGTTIYDILRDQGGDAEVACPGERAFSFAFVDISSWKNSLRDGEAILAAFRQTPQYVASQLHNPKTRDAGGERIARPVFESAIGTTEGRVTCLSATDQKGHAIVGVWDDGDIGLVLMAGSNKEEPEALKVAFLKFVVGLRIIRASGDASLLRWLQ